MTKKRKKKTQTNKKKKKMLGPTHPHPIETVESGNSIRFGKRGVVEHIVAKVVDGTVHGHDHLGNVNDFRRRFPNTMRAQ